MALFADSKTHNTSQIRNDAPEPIQKEFDYSHVDNSARVAIYDDMKSAPRILTIDPTTTTEFIQNLAVTVYTEAKDLGGEISYTNILEVTENFIHAQFNEMVVSILDNGNTIKFADQGPGIPDKSKVQQPGFSSATEGMKRYIRGVGSGLPLVKDYIDSFGGYITIEDNVRGGSVVTISLTKPQGPMAEELVDEVSSLDEREVIVINLLAENRELGVTELNKLTGFPTASVSYTLDKLERAGLIRKNSNKKRALTDKGKEVRATL